MRTHTNGRGTRPYSALINERNHIERLPLHNPDETEDGDPLDRAFAEGRRSNVIGVAMIGVIVVAIICMVLVTLWILHR